MAATKTPAKKPAAKPAKGKKCPNCGKTCFTWGWEG
jgi:hypothetical protein